MYPPKKPKTIDESYWQIILKCLNPDFEKRYESVAELAGAVKNGNQEEMKKRKLYKSFLEKAEQYIYSEKYNEAILNLQKAQTLYPENEELNDKITELNIKEEQKAKEEEKVARERKIQKLLNSGNSYLNSNNYDLAINSYQDVLRIDAQNKTAAQNLKKAKEQKASYEQEQARIVAARQKLANLFSEAEDAVYYENFDKAIKKYNEILSLDYGNGKAQKGLNAAKTKQRQQKAEAEKAKQQELLQKYNMVLVEGGTFKMGSDDEDSNEDEQPIHQVTLDTFYIGKYQVTQKEWKEIMGNNPSRFKGDNLPVEQVSWYDVQNFIKKLNTNTGLNYRLPTEAEWEYAARGGVNTNDRSSLRYAGSNNIDEVAWQSGEKWGSLGSTKPVGQKKPNELGIFDMSGNVWEWCSDWYGSYSSNSQTNPTGTTSGSGRVFRGGHWYYFARNCRVANRTYKSSDYSDDNLGFRLSCSSS